MPNLKMCKSCGTPHKKGYCRKDSEQTMASLAKQVTDMQASLVQMTNKLDHALSEVEELRMQEELYLKEKSADPDAPESPDAPIEQSPPELSLEFVNEAIKKALAEALPSRAPEKSPGTSAGLAAISLKSPRGNISMLNTLYEDPPPWTIRWPERNLSPVCLTPCTGSRGRVRPYVHCPLRNLTTG